MIVRGINAGSYFLEDLNARIQVDLTHAQTGPGLFTEGCIVIAQGDLVDPEDNEVTSTEEQMFSVRVF